MSKKQKRQKKNSSHPIKWDSIIRGFLYLSLLIAAAFTVALITKSLRNVNISTSTDSTNAANSFAENALTLLTLIIAIWAGLNIYNVLNNHSITEISQKYLELNKQIRWFFFLEKVKQFSWGDLSKLLPYSLDGENKLTEALIEKLIDIAEKFLKCKWEFDHCMNNICTEHCNELLKTISEYKDFQKVESLSIYFKIMIFSLCTYTERNKLRQNKKEDIDIIKLGNYIDEYIEIYNDYSHQTFIYDDLCRYMCLMIAYMKQLLIESKKCNDNKKYDDIENWYNKAISGPYPKSQCLQYYGIYLEKCKSDLVQAREKYEQALKVGDYDPKIYNLIGSLYLKLFDEENHVRTRFKDDKKTLAELTYTDKTKLLDKAISMLEIGKSAMPELTDIYANLAKGYMYKWLISPQKNSLYRNKSYEMISIAKNLSNGRIIMFAERNLYEADKKYQRALLQNQKIIDQLKDPEDANSAATLYSSRCKHKRQVIRHKIK